MVAEATMPRRGGCARGLPAPSWGCEEHHGYYEEAEEGVARGEDPGFGFEEDEVVEPVGDESVGVVGFLAAEESEAVFPDREGAGDGEPGFEDDVGDEEEVEAAEPAVADPLPALEPADDREHERDDHEGDEGGVEKEDEVSSDAISHAVGILY